MGLIMKKKSQLAFRTIIIAAIGLIVLAVLVYMLISRTTLFKRSIGECKGRGGDCKDNCSEDEIPTFRGCYVGNVYHKDYTCCMGVG